MRRTLPAAGRPCSRPRRLGPPVPRPTTLTFRPVRPNVVYCICEEARSQPLSGAEQRGHEAFVISHVSKRRDLIVEPVERAGQDGEPISGVNAAAPRLQLGFDAAQLLGPDFLGGTLRLPTQDKVGKEITALARKLIL